MPKSIEENVEDIIEILGVMQENMATTDDIAAVRRDMATKEELGSLRAEMRAGFQDIHAELRQMHVEIDDIKATLKRLKQKTQEDDGVMAAEVQHLKRRVDILEESLRKLKQQKPLP